MKKYIITVNGTSYEVVVEEADPNATYTPKAEAPKDKEETPKTILDMTIREVLEKLDEIIKR